MRLVRFPILLLTLVVAGCGAPTDPTPNRASSTGSDYPAGPYGYVEGTTIQNLMLIGKQSDAPTDYTTLPMKAISLADLRQGHGQGTDAKLILIDGAARWCTPCRGDQPRMKMIEANYASKGVVIMEAVVEGGYGIPATEDDINRWAAMFGLSGIIAIDPTYELSKYADLTAFPVYLVVRASTMKIEYRQVQALAASPIEPVLDQLLAQ